MKNQTKIIAEFVGSTLLLATVVGSGIMGQTLAGGNVAIALLANSLATGAMLYVLISVLGPISGAHFNPAVSLALVYMGRFEKAALGPYILVQISGAILGVLIAHAMFDLPLLQISETQRWGWGLWLAEALATGGLLLTIFGGLRFNPSAIPGLVGLYIIAAYWFTASTSFANPAVTLARITTNTFAGISPISAVPFIISQLIGAALAVVLAKILFFQSQSEN